MALSTPLLPTIAAFDASFSHTITFIVQGGDQVVANRLLIKRNDNLSIVYNNVIESYGFNHVIPENTLRNGVYYVAQIKTYGVGDDITDINDGSPWSSSSPFYCYTTPTLTWSNKPSDSIIKTSNFTFQFEYYQPEDEELYSYVVNLYDQSQILVNTSGTKYVSEQTSLSYLITGLIDDRIYYIEINGITVNNTQITSGKIFLLVNYYEPYAKKSFNVTNDACSGLIIINSNFAPPSPSSYPEEPIYVKNNTAVDVRNDGYYVKWDGINQSGDFCIRIWGYSFISNKEIFIYEQDDVSYNITLFRRDGYAYNSEWLQTYYELQIQTNSSNPYFIYSNYIDQPSENDKIFICIKRINNIYSLYIENLG